MDGKYFIEASLQMPVWSSRHWRYRTSQVTCELFLAAELVQTVHLNQIMIRMGGLLAYDFSFLRGYYYRVFSIGTVC